MDNRYSFIQLVRLGIGHLSSSFSVDVNWDEVEAIAERQGLSAIIVDGIDRLPDTQRPPKEKLLQMIGQVVQGYEHRYELYRRAIAELADFYEEHNMKMMVLKGYACSLNWPKPEHRPCGDIDIWQFGRQKEGDTLIEKEKNIKIDNSHHHHSVFFWRGFSVENHYDFINVHHHKSNKGLESVLKKLGEDDSNWVELYGNRVYLPSPNLHALFLLKHMMADFAATNLTLRQVLDWAFFVENHSEEIDWDWLEKVIEEYGMKRMYDVINTICISNLGFDEVLFPNIVFKPELKDKVLNEILNPAIPNEKPKYLLPRLLWKWNRWKVNGWKHKLVYKESLWSAFWSGVWGHLMKPKTI